MPVDRHVFKNFTFVCPKDEQKVIRLCWDYDPAPTCACGETMQHDVGQFEKAPCVIGDDIPGGFWATHAICNPDGSPKRYDTKSSMREAAKALGYENVVEHKPDRGSDKSKWTTRWI